MARAVGPLPDSDLHTSAPTSEAADNDGNSLGSVPYAAPTCDRPNRSREPGTMQNREPPG